MKKWHILLALFFCIGVMSFADSVYKTNVTASYYADKFHGRKTSNGETFNMWAMTAAHKSLPFNTLVKVTNLANGKSVTVRINDRGPFVAGREIDLSKGAAAKLDMIRSGTAKVSLTIIGESTTNPVWQASQASTNQRWDIQVGAFSKTANATALMQRLQAAGFSNLAYQNAGAITRVVIRNLSSDEVPLYVRRLEQNGFTDHLVRERPSNIR